MDDGKETEVLAWLTHLDPAVPAFMAAVLQYPNRKIALRQSSLRYLIFRKRTAGGVLGVRFATTGDYLSP